MREKQFMKEILDLSVRYFIYALLLASFLFGIFMVARRIKDEHLSGAFALSPVVVLLFIFFGLVVFSFLRDMRTGRRKEGTADKQR